MVEVAARAARAGTVSAVLDCEIVAFDPAASRILPFQVCVCVCVCVYIYTYRERERERDRERDR